MAEERPHSSSDAQWGAGVVAPLLGELEEEVQRLREEVEACSIMVLSLDAAVNAGGAAVSLPPPAASGAAEVTGAREDLVPRIEVLEEAWALRSGTVGQRVEEAVERLEKEIIELWRTIRLKDAKSAVTAEELEQVRVSMHEVQDQVQAVRQEVQTCAPVAERQAVEALAKQVQSEVGRTAREVEEKCNRLGDMVTALEAAELDIQVERERSQELERSLDLLAQQQREDAQERRVQQSEVEAQFRRLDEKEAREESWRSEADALRGEFDDLRTSRFPAVCHQFTYAAEAISEGLQELRREVRGMQALPSNAAASSFDVAWVGEAAALRAELMELRQQVTEEVCGGFDDRLAKLRADVGSQVSAALLEMKEAWAGASRRLASLEGCSTEQAALWSELRALRVEHAEARSLSRPPREREGHAGHASTWEGSPAAGRSAARHRALREEEVGKASQSRTSPGSADRAAATSTPMSAPVVLGKRVEWALPASALEVSRRARRGSGILVTEELEVAGTWVRLKFFPDGSPLRQMEGFCSLYLFALVSSTFRFRLFAGQHWSPVLEASGKRDQGRHDLCQLVDALEDDGGIVVGAEIL